MIAFLAILHAFMHRPLGADGCVVPMMTPTYLRMVGFDAEHTRFASKYNLFLYREEGIDPYSKDNPGVGRNRSTELIGSYFGLSRSDSSTEYLFYSYLEMPEAINKCARWLLRPLDIIMMWYVTIRNG